VVKAVIGSLVSAFMASVENSGSGIARVKKGSFDERGK
jgi:hypothetical protein